MFFVRRRRSGASVRPARRLVWLGGLLLGTLTGCAAVRVDKAAQASTGLASLMVCSSTFVEHQDPATAFTERVQALRGMGLVNWGLRYQVNTEAKDVTSSVAGMFERRAVFRDGVGCVVQREGEVLEAVGPLPADAPGPVLLADIAGPEAVTTAHAPLQAAIDLAFTEPDLPAWHRTRAVLVMRDGMVLAERYAEGYGVATPLSGQSMSKSLTHALVGVLVQQGRLQLHAPAPVREWADPSDPRHAITLDHLLRHTSGLDLKQDNSGFDANTQILFNARDKAAASAAAPLAAPPGTRWNYTDTNYLLLSRIVRETVGGKPADVVAFARRELLDPLGMRHVTMEFDAAGTPMGANGFYAPARDWARLGQLYLDDGVAGGRRLLPAGWVAEASRPSLEGYGQGAGFWTNRAKGNVPGWGVPWSMARVPADAIFARGFMGQYTVVVPSQRLVIVRLSRSNVMGDDLAGTNDLVGNILDAMPPASP